ncbi:MAG TPA: imidazole glycerol phosphate synthase subunit HisH [Gammaproteobacteria bacterium]
MKTIAVIDYGMGNLRSVAKAVEHVAAADMRVRLTSSPRDIETADRIVFPGQGAAGECMAALGRHELNDSLLAAAAQKPFLGVCMGLQVLLSFSRENGGVPCLDIIEGTVEYFGARSELKSAGYKIPHMGWNRVRQTSQHPLWRGIDDNSRFYFVHSYYVQPTDELTVLGTTDYGIEFASALGRENLFAVQFHPEKSAQAGLKLLHNFVNWNGQTR